MNGVCKICGHKDNPLLPGMVPNVIGETQFHASTLITGPEAKLTIGNVTDEASETVPAGNIISSNPVASTQLEIGAAVDIVISTGPAG